MSTAMIEKVPAHGKALAYVLRRETLVAPETTFFTPPEEHLQVGIIVYRAGGEVGRHSHMPLPRTLDGTTEVLVVQSGHCEVDLYSDERHLVKTVKLRPGDVIVMVSGGHGLRMLEDTRLLEVKQGPYLGLEDKEGF